MKRIFASEIRERDRIEGIFLVSKKEMPISKNGKPYLNLRLMDKTGGIEGRAWDNVLELAKGFDKDDFVEVRAWAILYQGKIQLNISSIEKYPEEKVSVEDFLPSSPNDADDMMKEMECLVRGIKNKYLKELLGLFLSDKNIRELWKKAPAAKTMHHTYLGGLLEHTISLSKLALDVSKYYQQGNGSEVSRGVDEDLLLTGAILHDIGKIYELSYHRGFGYTDEGRLLGHITIGVGMIEKKITEIPDFPEELAMLLKHMVLSHHGLLEYGSPKRPKTLEAVILNYMDDMDSKVQSIRSFIEKEGKNDSRWTGYHRLYDRYLYKGTGDSNKGHFHEYEKNLRTEEPPVESKKGSQGEIDRDLFTNTKG